MVAAAAAVVRWWWPQWLMDNGPSREGCLRSLARVKTHAERTKSEEKGEQATELEGKGVQKRQRPRRENTEVPCASVKGRRRKLKKTNSLWPWSSCGEPHKERPR